MKLCGKQIVLFILAMFCAANLMPAQNIPVLPADPAIKTGRLPNGMSYYVIENNTIKGIADFALIQKTGTGNIADTSSYRAVSVAREGLSSLPRCTAPSVQSFLTSHGVVPGKDGFVKVSANSTEYHFKDVLLSEKTVLDSTLLVILDIVDRVSTTEDGFISKWYSPSDQAVIVSGDVNADDVIFKLRTLSLMTPSSSSSERIAYRWEASDSVKFIPVEDKVDGLSSITLSWRSPRTPEEYMNTVQPAIYEMFLAELGLVLEDYAKDALRREDIPYAGLSCRFKASAQSSGDEVFNISMCVEDENFKKAVQVLAKVISEVDSGHTSIDDFLRAKMICTDAVHEESRKPIRNNSSYVDKCATAFLYNGSLSTLKSKVDFLSSRNIADSTELRLFNGISSALLDPQKNLVVHYPSDIAPDTVALLLDASWKSAPDTAAYAISAPADIPMHDPSGVKMKIKSVKTDHMSKGEVWTFSNGFNVIYKKMDTGGRLYYSLALNGGFGSVPDLERGEGGYVSDQFFLSRIGDIPADDFLDKLHYEGISMESYVGLSYMMLNGYAPVGKTDLLMRSLLSAVNDRKPDAEAARYHARCEVLSQRLDASINGDRKSVIDSIMCPDYKFTSLKSAYALTDGLPEKADRYFRGISGRMNDGVLILLGDMDEYELKKILLKYVDGFRTTDRAFKRQMIRYQPVSGKSAYMVEGCHDAIDIAMSVPMSLTTDGYMAAEIAAMILKKYVSEAIADAGMYMELSHECKIYPQERFSILISVREADENGFSSDTEGKDPFEILSVIRSVLSEAAEKDIPSSEVDMFKTQLKGAVALEMSDPYYWLNVISRRYLAGKDFTTNYQARIDAVTPDKVRAVLRSMDKGTRVEYIVTGN